MIPLGVALAAEVAPPRVFLDTTYIQQSGREIVVAAGGDFQAALDAALPGDMITLEAGATFVGNFTLRNKMGTGWIYIRSSAHASLPPPGTRVNPVHATLMPKIVSPNIFPVIGTEEAAHHYRFIGLEITTTHSVTTSTHHNLIILEAPGGQSSLSQVPTDIVFDRCYLHGTPTGNVRRGIALNSAHTAVIDSYLSDFHEVGVDSQAILGWNGPGPFKIVNNYLEGAGENVMFGGGDPSVQDLVPSDIEIRHNHFFKPLSWKADDPSYAGIPWTIKNLFELKNAQRVLIEGNIFEHSWVHEQNGFAILFTVRNQDGTAPWSVVQDVTFTQNIVRHANSGVSIIGTDDVSPSQRTKRILVKDNLIENLDAFKYGPNTSFNTIFQLLAVASPNPSMPGGILDLTIDHNTGRIRGISSLAVGMGGSTDDFAKHENFVFQNNLVESSVVGSGTAEGTVTLTTFTKPDYIFVKNVLIGRPSSLYPPDNFFPATDGHVGFVDLPGGDFSLAPSSPFRGAGTDGKDIGVNIEALDAATAGVIDGVTNDSSPPTIVPSVSTQPNENGWHNTAVTVSWSVSDDESGIASSTGCGAVTLEADTGGTTLTCLATNRGGVSASESVTIRIDRTPPVVMASRTPVANSDGWNNTNVTVSLGATDGADGSGVKELIYSGTGAQAVASTVVAEAAASISITTEGVTTLAYFARDHAGNEEAARMLTVRIDKTSPEAYIQFDPATRDVAVFGQDALSGVPTGPVAPLYVVPRQAYDREEDDEDERDEDEDEEQWEPRTYQVMDLAGNSLLLGEKVKRKDDEVKAHIKSLQYNNGSALTPPKNRVRLQQQVRREGSLKELKQEMVAGKGRKKQEIQAEFEAKKDQTIVKVEKPGPDINMVKPGLVLLRMVTDKGDLDIEF